MAVAPLLFFGRIISRITSATIGTGFTDIADVTPEKDRARAFGLVGVAFGLGFVVGPALGGLLGMALYSLASVGEFFLVGVPVMSLWGLSGPAILGMMSRLVSPSEQGQLQG